MFANTEPFVTLVGVAVKRDPLHTVVVNAVIVATGFTVIVNTNVGPIHPAADLGVIVNVAVKEKNYSGKREFMCPLDGW